MYVPVLPANGLTLCKDLNLDNPEYMDVILESKESLENAFADISQQEVMRKMQNTKKNEAKIPRNILLLIR